MFTVLTHMAALIACGVAWRFARPGGVDADATRRALTAVVYYLLLPALVLQVLWRAPLGLDTARIAAAAAAGVLACMLASYFICRGCRMPRAVTGAAILAAAFPNATYLGLPVLEATFGTWARSVAIQYDLFACTPLLLTVGILIAEALGTRNRTESPLAGLLRVPPLWAAVVAVALNALAVPTNDWLDGMLSMLGSGVVPLMLISLGLSLQWGAWHFTNLKAMLPVLFVQLLLMPVVVWAVAHFIGLEGQTLQAVVLEGAMPSMVLGVVISDRFGLDTALYAAAVTTSTLLSLATLPLWFHLLGG
ncbi:MAG: AEC family transporter [Gammaproteobacteria bacterium]